MIITPSSRYSLYLSANYGLMGLGVSEVTLLQCLLFGCIVSAVDPVAVLAIFQEVRYKKDMIPCNSIKGG